MYTMCIVNKQHNNWLVVWNLFSIYWECHHPNWLIFFRGFETTSQIINKPIRDGWKSQLFLISRFKVVYVFFWVCHRDLLLRWNPEVPEVHGPVASRLGFSKWIGLGWPCAASKRVSSCCMTKTRFGLEELGNYKATCRIMLHRFGRSWLALTRLGRVFFLGWSLISDILWGGSSKSQWQRKASCHFNVWWRRLHRRPSG